MTVVCASQTPPLSKLLNFYLLVKVSSIVSKWGHERGPSTTSLCNTSAKETSQPATVYHLAQAQTGYTSIVSIFSLQRGVVLNQREVCLSVLSEGCTCPLFYVSGGVNMDISLIRPTRALVYCNAPSLRLTPQR